MRKRGGSTPEEEIDTWRHELQTRGEVCFGLSLSRSLGLVAGCAAIFAVAAILLSSGHWVGWTLAVAMLLVFGGFAVPMNLELATARGPAVRVTAEGITLSQWWPNPLHIPWGMVVAVDAQVADARRSNAMAYTLIRVPAEFHEQMVLRRPAAVRWLTWLRSAATGPAFEVTFIVRPRAHELARWLSEEAARRG